MFESFRAIILVTTLSLFSAPVGAAVLHFEIETVLDRIEYFDGSISDFNDFDVGPYRLTPKNDIWGILPAIPAGTTRTFSFSLDLDKTFPDYWRPGFYWFSDCNPACIEGYAGKHTSNYMQNPFENSGAFMWGGDWSDLLVHGNITPGATVTILHPYSNPYNGSIHGTDLWAHYLDTHYYYTVRETRIFTDAPAPVPLPAGAALLTAALCLFACLRRRRAV